MNYTPLSESLNNQILSLAPPHIGCEDAPNSYKALTLPSAYDSQGRLRVYNGGSERTIYGSNRVNLAFRAWHDSLHLQYGLTFQPDDEIELASIHASMIKGDYEKRLIMADVKAQVLHWQKFNAYVEDQRGFVVDYLKTGKIEKR
jgi:hypothetical protein